MKNTKVTLVPLTADDCEQFILDNQWVFKYGAMMEFGERDDHTDEEHRKAPLSDQKAPKSQQK